MEEKTEERQESLLRQICREDRLEPYLEEYLAACKGEGETGKEAVRFPNIAGFCRFLKVGVQELERIREEYSTAYEYLVTVLEDEALNFPLSPTLLSTYLKKRMGYEKEKERKLPLDEMPLQICFEHDIFEDGA